MKEQLDQVRKQARDLRREEPRPAGEKLGGFPMGMRCLDKCRASLLGWEGTYRYGCPMDEEFLAAAGIDVEEFRQFVATGASDCGVDKWVRMRSHARLHRRPVIAGEAT